MQSRPDQTGGVASRNFLSFRGGEAAEPGRWREKQPKRKTIKNTQPRTNNGLRRRPREPTIFDSISCQSKARCRTSLSWSTLMRGSFALARPPPALAPATTTPPPLPSNDPPWVPAPPVSPPSSATAGRGDGDVGGRCPRWLGEETPAPPPPPVPGAARSALCRKASSSRRSSNALECHWVQQKCAWSSSAAPWQILSRQNKLQARRGQGKGWGVISLRAFWLQKRVIDRPHQPAGRRREAGGNRRSLPTRVDRYPKN